MSKPRPVVMILIDAADEKFVRQLIDEGKLPVLAKLAKSGRFEHLATSDPGYSGGVWASFYTGRPVRRHGLYHNKLWRAKPMRIELANEAWVPDRPFYERVAAAGLRVCAIDVPMVVGEPKVGADGIFLGGWGTHDLIARGSRPKGLWSDLVKRHGPPTMEVERFGRQDVAGLLRLRDQMLRSNEQLAEITLDLMQGRPFDLTCLVFGAVHRGGHYLYDLSQIDTTGLDDRDRQLLEGALVEIYRGTDDAIGKVLAATSPDAVTFVFALHGMERNNGMADYFADLLMALDQAVSGTVAKRGLLYRIKRALPFHLVRPILTRLPAGVGHRLATLWSMRMFDWRKTSHFAMPTASSGYVRINLKGRERDGIVEPGAEYAALCARLEAMLSGLRDGESGRALVTCIERPWSEASEPAERRDLLPDLLVHWASPVSPPVRRIVCDALPAFSFALPERFPSGRAGNHRPDAWLIANGAGIGGDDRPLGAEIIDLAPTALALLGLPPDPSMSGRVLALQESRVTS